MFFYRTEPRSQGLSSSLGTRLAKKDHPSRSRCAFVPSSFRSRSAHGLLLLPIETPIALHAQLSFIAWKCLRRRQGNPSKSMCWMWLSTATSNNMLSVQDYALDLWWPMKMCSDFLSNIIRIHLHSINGRKQMIEEHWIILILNCRPSSSLYHN